MRVSIFAIALVVWICAVPALGHTQGIVISDCQGFTRAAQQVNPGTKGQLKINITDAAGNPADGTQVTLTNTVTGEVTTAAAQNGVVTFEGLGAGNFVVDTSLTGMQLGTMALATEAGVLGASAGVVVGGAAVGGGAVGAGLVGVEVVDVVQGTNEDPTPTPTPIPTPVPTFVPTAVPSPTPTPDCECDPNVTPEPVTPFFNPTPPGGDQRVQSARGPLSPSS